MASGSFQAVENSTWWQTPVFPVLRTGRQKDPNCKKLPHIVTSRPVCARANQQLAVLSTVYGTQFSSQYSGQRLQGIGYPTSPTSELHGYLHTDIP